MWAILDFNFEIVCRAKYYRIKHGILYTKDSFLGTESVWAPGTWAYINEED